MTSTRIKALQSQLNDGQFFYSTDLISIRYLTNFTGSNAGILVSKNETWLATDSRYEIQAKEQVCEINLVIGRNISELLLRPLPTSAVVLEGTKISARAYEVLVANFDHDFALADGIVERMRVVKDANELSHIRTACEISVQAFEDIILRAEIGQTEKTLRNLLENRMRELGADDKAFASIVAGGPHSAIPHHEPTDRPISKGDLLKVDFGAKVNGYHSDCTRTVSIGSPYDWQVQLHSAVTNAQRVGRQAVQAQAQFDAVEKSVKDSLKGSGYLEYFSHGLGHGVGLEIHEEPFFGRAPDAKIAENTVITIEPGAYLVNQGGVRVEDTIVATSDGHQNLTNLPYELLEI